MVFIHLLQVKTIHVFLGRNRHWLDIGCVPLCPSHAKTNTVFMGNRSSSVFMW